MVSHHDLVIRCPESPFAKNALNQLRKYRGCSLAFLGRVWANVGMETTPTDKLLSHLGLESVTIADLRTLFERVLKTRPSLMASIDFLKGNIAWALQARNQGHTPPTLREGLIKRVNGRHSRATNAALAGTRLIREWQGTTHQVTVLDRGYLWEGARYNSLSRIAKEITGTRWSGPRFFGLKEQANG